MEEQRQRQEQEARKAGTTDKEAARPETIKEGICYKLIYLASIYKIV